MSRTREVRAKALEDWADRVDPAELRYADTEVLRKIGAKLGVSKQAPSESTCRKHRRKGVGGRNEETSLDAGLVGSELDQVGDEHTTVAAYR